MRRLAPIDLAALLALLPLWVACTALHTYRAAHDGLAWPFVYVAAGGPQDHPVLSGFWPGMADDNPTLRVGDVLLSLAGQDLRGVGPVEFSALAMAHGGFDVPLRVLRQGESIDTELRITPLLFQWRYLPLALSYAAAGVLVLLRSRSSLSARAFFLATVTYSFLWLRAGIGAPAATYFWIVTATAAGALAPPLILRATLVLPESAAPRARWPFAAAWTFALLGPLMFCWHYDFPLSATAATRAMFVLWILFGLSLLAVLTRNFRRADPVGRRRIKWVLYGLYVGAVPVIAADVVGAVRPELSWVSSLSSITLIVIPWCVFLAVARFNLWDIDRVISTTAAYSILTVIVLAAVLTIVPSASQAASAAAGLDPGSGQVLLSLVLAGLIVPGQRLLQPRLERVFFAERHAMDRGIERLLRSLSSCEQPQQLLTLAVEELHLLLRTSSCVFYACTESGYAPVVARGRGLPTEWAAESAVVRALRSGAPVQIDAWRRRVAAAAMSRQEWAALDGLEAAVLLPMVRQNEMAAFIALGRKRSGDVYTATDMALLAAVTDKISAELMRFDEAEILRQERAMQQALRRYVSDPIAARVLGGDDLAAARREVSVLFVDIRGYTTYSEGREAEEIFSMINRYTETVSKVVYRHGGTVVEFTGDGVMAVFGAPDELPAKEAAATAAGRGIVSAVHSLALDGGVDGKRLAVGVGIATGEAVVGSIRSADRYIWTAIGNTPNLAARLQALSRQLEAAIVVDACTFTAAGTAAADFEMRPQVPIRGRRELEDVYLLPLSEL